MFSGVLVVGASIRCIFLCLTKMHTDNQQVFFLKVFSLRSVENMK